ncbi:MAG TPA: hypothetical protein VKA68_10890, partial [bacterium]|nr:hypothetical protein [bacterium]
MVKPGDEFDPLDMFLCEQAVSGAQLLPNSGTVDVCARLQDRFCAPNARPASKSKRETHPAVRNPGFIEELPERKEAVEIDQHDPHFTARLTA